MIIGADLEYKDQNGQDRYQKTSQKLLDEASYVVMITEDIKSKTAKGDAIIDGLFKV